jgi:hypothetical protein
MSHQPPQPHQRHVVTSFALPDRGGGSSSSGSGNNMPVTRQTGAAAPNTSLGRIHSGNQQQDRAMNSMTALEPSDNLRDSSNSLQWLQLVRDVFRGSLVCWTVWHMWFAQSAVQCGDVRPTADRSSIFCNVEAAWDIVVACNPTAAPQQHQLHLEKGPSHLEPHVHQPTPPPGCCCCCCMHWWFAAVVLPEIVAPHCCCAAAVLGQCRSRWRQLALLYVTLTGQICRQQFCQWQSISTGTR